MLKSRWSFLLLLFGVKFHVVLQMQEASLEKLHTQLSESHIFLICKNTAADVSGTGRTH
jgi:hypothetical protein